MNTALDVALVNPLGVALKHYTASLERLLTDCGAVVASTALMEPSAPGQSRRKWIGEYVQTLRRVASGKSRRRANIVIQTWPVLGYWDYPVSKLALRHSQSFIILHDPHPLVKAVGYGRLARWIASRPSIEAATIVHSESAFGAVRGDTGFRSVFELPLPMFPPKQPARRDEQHVIIRVIGQYKADRDIESMKRLAAHGPRDWSYEVIGRGWPPIEGWNTTNRFVAEDEFDALVEDSSVILIPYRRFFQSGVAIRSLERGTPVVGPRSSSLADVLGNDNAWLADGLSWDQAVQAAVRAEPQEIYQIASSVYNTTLQRWRGWLDSQM